MVPAAPGPAREVAPDPGARGGTRPAAAPLATADAPGAVVGSSPQRIGVVTHYFSHATAAVVALEGVLRVGDTVHVRGHTTDYYQRVDRIEMDHAPVETAQAGQSVGIHVAQRVRPHDVVYRLVR